MTESSGGRRAGERRMLRIIGVLSGHEVNGLSGVEIAHAVGALQSTISRDMHLLRSENYVEQIAETKRWRLGPKIVQIARAYELALDRAKRRLEETEQRYTRLPT